jgi:hypothetical protein
LFCVNPVSCMFLVAESTNTDLPLYSFCNKPLIGSKYARPCIALLNKIPFKTKTRQENYRNGKKRRVKLYPKRNQS